MKLRAQLSQWSRAAWALSALSATLPLASRLFLGSWGFPGAGALSFLFLALGTYLYFRARRARTLADDAASLAHAIQLASLGQEQDAVAILSRTIRRSARLWQARQYRGEMHLRLGSPAAALEDFDKAIQLAPDEAHLYVLRSEAHLSLGDVQAAQDDAETAAALKNR